MRVTILFIALVVGEYLIDDGHPEFGWALIGVAFWEATMQESWNKPGHWAQVGIRPGSHLSVLRGDSVPRGHGAVWLSIAAGNT